MKFISYLFRKNVFQEGVENKKSFPSGNRTPAATMRARNPNHQTT